MQEYDLMENGALLEGLHYGISDEILWKLPARKMYIPLEDLRWNLYHKVWGTPYQSYNFAPIELLNDFDNPNFAYHKARVLKADLRFYCVTVVHPVYQRYFIYDGYHRLTKAFLNGKKKVRIALVECKALERLEEVWR
jgi:hypothetical protein